ncbi:MAG: hypothetical protein CSA11_11445 [Chloroflexi bacterium]|nr:MAG: hypothetical protein CSB13_04940 [Chloroflexota bacterium]PIE79600.1 MAG: hypothetical protein CSA11_11445 [Chloroflexota bacterium]
MYGINLVKVAQILGSVAVSNLVFNKYGVIRSIHQEIIKYSAQKNIEMVKVMMRMLAQQNEQAHKEIVDILRKHFSEQELQEILHQGEN